MKRLSFLIKEKVYVEIVSGQKSVNEKHKNDLFRSFHHYYTYISNFIKKNSTLTKKNNQHKLLTVYKAIELSIHYINGVHEVIRTPDLLLRSDLETRL